MRNEHFVVIPSGGHRSDDDGSLGTLTLAQDLNAKRLFGTWRGTTPSPMEGKVDEREIVFREDGSITREVKSAKGGLLIISGSYKITSTEVVVDSQGRNNNETY